ncbi:MAG: hypothetical protein Q9183_004169, partial [Haloplaca sp. 2 TL-2023]
MELAESLKAACRKGKENGVVWKRGGDSSQIKLDGLKSRIFKILVGPEGTAFTIHEAYLCQSPVLERICHADFIESKTLEIKLPEDDPKIFAAIGNYLYTGEIWEDEITNDPGQPVDTTMLGTEDILEAATEYTEIVTLLADVYIAAERYDLKHLKLLVVEKLSAVTDIQLRPISFLKIAEKLYPNIPDTDEAYRSFFHKNLSNLLDKTRPNDMNEELRNTFDDCVSGGGTLAIDAFRALNSIYIEQLSACASNGEARVAEAEARVAKAEARIPEAKARVAEAEARVVDQRKKTQSAETEMQ